LPKANKHAAWIYHPQTSTTAKSLDVNVIYQITAGQRLSVE